MNDRIEAAINLLGTVESLLISIAASLSSSTGAPSKEATFGSLIGVQRLIEVAKDDLDNALGRCVSQIIS